LILKNKEKGWFNMVFYNKTSIRSTNLIGAVIGNKVNNIRIKDINFKYGPELDLCQELAKGPIL
jgi:hypothetical protein